MCMCIGKIDIKPNAWHRTLAYNKKSTTQPQRGSRNYLWSKVAVIFHFYLSVIANLTKQVETIRLIPETSIRWT